MHRKFYLENNQQQRYNLQDLKSGALLVSPSGLGLSMTRSYAIAGDSVRCISEEFPARSFTAVIVLDGTRAYDGYRELADFIIRSSNIKLVYAPRFESTFGEYLADVEVESFTKTEVKGGRLECDIALTLKGAWYKRDSLRVAAGTAGSSLQYERMYDYSYSDETMDAIDVINDGHFDAPILLEAEGELVNPKLSLYVDGLLQAELVVTTVIELGETLVFCSKDDQLTLVRKHADGSEQSLMDCISIENDNFFKLPKGLTKLILSADNEIASRIFVTVFMAYKVV